MNFDHFLKLYYFRAEKRVSLSIQVSASSVFTAHLSQDQFDTVVKEARSRGGIRVGSFFFHHKGSYIRFTHYGESFENNLRIPTGKWEKLMAEYSEKRIGRPEEITAIIIS